jgi:hypothetical protein
MIDVKGIKEQTLGWVKFVSEMEWYGNDDFITNTDDAISFLENEGISVIDIRKACWEITGDDGNSTTFFTDEAFIKCANEIRDENRGDTHILFKVKENEK